MTTSTELLPYQAESLAEFYDSTIVTDQNILEIGGFSPHAVPHDLVSHGAASIVTVNYHTRFLSEQVTDKITAIQTDAGTLAFPDNTFDSVISIATIEHINTLSEVLVEAYRVLKPNGVMYINGGPLWSSKTGSHYTFTVGDIRYHYLKNRILNDWEHLLSNKEEIRSRLTSIHSSEVIDNLLYEIYDNPKINRLFPAELIEIVSNSKFSIVSSKLSIWYNTDMPNYMKEAVKLKFLKFDNGYDSMQFYLRKPLV